MSSAELHLDVFFYRARNHMAPNFRFSRPTRRSLFLRKFYLVGRPSSEYMLPIYDDDAPSPDRPNPSSSRPAEKIARYTAFGCPYISPLSGAGASTLKGIYSRLKNASVGMPTVFATFV